MAGLSSKAKCVLGPARSRVRAAASARGWAPDGGANPLPLPPPLAVWTHPAAAAGGGAGPGPGTHTTCAAGRGSLAGVGKAGHLTHLAGPPRPDPPVQPPPKALGVDVGSKPSALPRPSREAAGPFLFLKWDQPKRTADVCCEDAVFLFSFPLSHVCVVCVFFLFLSISLPLSSDI